VARRRQPSDGGSGPPPIPPLDPAEVRRRTEEAAALNEDDGAWLSQRDAARQAGVTVDVIRRWRQAGTIAERQSPDQPRRVEVFLPGDRHELDGQQGPAGDELPHSELGVLVPLEVHQRSLAELILRLTETTERAVRAETEVRFLREQLGNERPS
jgi:hypothetical protein